MGIVAAMTGLFQVWIVVVVGSILGASIMAFVEAWRDQADDEREGFDWRDEL